MRNVLKTETLERKFPLLSVENGCIVSKDADLTVAFEVELPELFTMTAAEYEAVHSSWVKAVKVLPDFSVVCKQDWFTKETYRPDFRDGVNRVSCRKAMSVISTSTYLKPQMLPVSDEDHA